MVYLPTFAKEIAKKLFSILYIVMSIEQISNVVVREFRYIYTIMRIEKNLRPKIRSHVGWYGLLVNNVVAVQFLHCFGHKFNSLSLDFLGQSSYFVQGEAT